LLAFRLLLRLCLLFLFLFTAQKLLFNRFNQLILTIFHRCRRRHCYWTALFTRLDASSRFNKIVFNSDDTFLFLFLNIKLRRRPIQFRSWLFLRRLKLWSNLRLDYLQILSSEIWNRVCWPTLFEERIDFILAESAIVCFRSFRSFWSVRNPRCSIFFGLRVLWRFIFGSKSWCEFDDGHESVLNYNKVSIDSTNVCSFPVLIDWIR
jgi:hypothetical protein